MNETDQARADQIPPVVGSLWKSRAGREVLNIHRVWLSDVWLVRGHPVRGGRPLVCPVTYLREHYNEEAADAR